jgi:hypothetical protein
VAWACADILVLYPECEIEGDDEELEEISGYDPYDGV